MNEFTYWALGAVTGGFLTTWGLSLARLVSEVKSKAKAQP